MDIRKDKRGFSLIELIITMAIMAVFAGAIIGGMSYINAGKTKKAAARLNNKISSIQTATMTKKGQTFLYIYRTSDGVYSTVVSSKIDTNGDGNPDYPKGFTQRSELDQCLSSGKISGDKLCDSTVTITGKQGTGGSNSVTLSESNFLKLGYSKSTGAFNYSNDGSLDTNGEFTDVPFYSMIEMSGKEKFSIKLVKISGKHFVKKG